jgi:glyoxylase-like metal-dependent hydrolase (beta-lactamase superfamily II)
MTNSQSNESKTNTDVKPEIKAFFDNETNTFSYIVKDPSSHFCAIIDPVLNFDYASGAVSFEGAQKIIEYIKHHQLHVEWIIETHVHADHLSAAPYLKDAVGGKIGIGEHIAIVQNKFGTIFNLDRKFCRNGSQFDYLFKDEEVYSIGNIKARAIHTPGHTPACMTHVCGDAAFVGDTLFMPDGGTARADFPGGDACELYQSIQKVLSLPPETRIFVCHDYAPNGREVQYETTVLEERNENIHVNSSIKEADFIKMREARDKTLGMPKLILPALQTNIRAGNFPDPENNNTVYLKIPLNTLNKQS